MTHEELKGKNAECPSPTTCNSKAQSAGCEVLHLIGLEDNIVAVGFLRGNRIAITYDLLGSAFECHQS